MGSPSGSTRDDGHFGRRQARETSRAFDDCFAILSDRDHSGQNRKRGVPDQTSGTKGFTHQLEVFGFGHDLAANTGASDLDHLAVVAILSRHLLRQLDTAWSGWCVEKAVFHDEIISYAFALEIDHVADPEQFRHVCLRLQCEKYITFGILRKATYNRYMIGSIKGKISHKSASYVIVETSGVGYKVFLPQVILLTQKIDDVVSLVIHTYVREDQLTLFGFETLAQLEFFELLLTVSGVGPKSALAIMSLAAIDMLKSAIASGDATVFKKVSGIGTKTAERVIVELKEKLKDEVQAGPMAQQHSDAVDALLALGYSQQEARAALKNIPKDIKDLQTKVKMALKSLHK
ncbi:MAG TPA: Holliday junction branch migration protein RuvA [Patescibacteria group bacterium]